MIKIIVCFIIKPAVLNDHKANSTLPSPRWSWQPVFLPLYFASLIMFTAKKVFSWPKMQNTKKISFTSSLSTQKITHQWYVLKPQKTKTKTKRTRQYEISWKLAEKNTSQVSAYFMKLQWSHRIVGDRERETETEGLEWISVKDWKTWEFTINWVGAKQYHAFKTW